LNAPQSRTRTRLLVTLATTVVALLVVEVGFRVRAYKRNAEVLDVAFQRSTNPEPGAPADLIDIIRPSPHQRIVYELKANLDRAYFKRHPVSTNSMGFRSKEYPAEKSANTVVVFGLGDSLMFGHGVPDGQDCMAHLDEELNRRFPEKEWRVYNSGVPGYNTVMEVATLRAKGLPLEPDVVVLNIVGNDLVLPQYMRSEEDVFDLGKSFFVDYIRDSFGRDEGPVFDAWAKAAGAELARRARAVRFQNGELLVEVEPATDLLELKSFVEHYRQLANEALGRDSIQRIVFKLPQVGGLTHKTEWRTDYENDLDAIPEEYRGMSGMEAFENALDELRALSAEHGFTVIAFNNVNLAINPTLLAKAAERGFHTFTVHQDLVDYIEKETGAPFSVESYTSSKLVVNRTNLHPSVLHHRIAAHRLVEEMIAIGLVQELIDE